VSKFGTAAIMDETLRDIKAKGKLEKAFPMLREGAVKTDQEK
jgi:hypothetical protein